ncbi:hypothetical protein GJ496_002535 [Pomphorhynchus laevis]|nr:hypothetical protein GJ496_002535 [Pomphorhynchus laevis]
MITDTSPDNMYLNYNSNDGSPVNTSKVNILKKRIKLIKPLPFIEETLSQNRLTDSVSSLNRFRTSKQIHRSTLHNTENVDPLTPVKDKPEYESSITVKTSKLIQKANDDSTVSDGNSIINVHSRREFPCIGWKSALEKASSTCKNIRDNIDMESFAKFPQNSQDKEINYLRSTFNETNSLTKCDNGLKGINALCSKDTKTFPFFNIPNLYRLCMGISNQFNLQAPTLEFAEFIMRIAEEFCRNLVEDIILSAYLRNKLINDELFTEDSNLKRQIKYLNNIKRCQLEESTKEHSEPSDESGSCEAGKESDDSEYEGDSEYELTEIELRQLEDLNKAALEAIGNRRHKANSSNINQLTHLKKLKPKLTIGMKDIIRSLENRNFPNKSVILQYGYEGMFDKFKPSSQKPT